MTSRGRPASRQDLARSDGLTILELLIALTLLAVVVGGLYRFVATGSQSARLTNSFLQIQAQARAALGNAVDPARRACPGGRGRAVAPPPRGSESRCPRPLYPARPP